MTDHILVIGYGDTGRCAVNAVLASQPDARLTVLDKDFFAVAEAAANGADAVVGDGRDRCALDEVAAGVADRVVVAVPDDLNAFLIMKSIRRLNPEAVVVVIVREPENHSIFVSEEAVTVHVRQPDDRKT
ncbi:NAD-binding protein [Lentzea sp. NPDC058436]|uniref:NAD-binding protein n=1 Tax=Lentzea sp. NPDC058436 TaxID=3346499 RepID=UPI0036567A0B